MIPGIVASQLLGAGGAAETFTFADVVFLAGFNGADGATTYTDESSYAHVATFSGGAALETSIQKFGTASAQFVPSGQLSFPHNAAFNIGTEPFCMEFQLRLLAGGLTTQAIFGHWDTSGGSPFKSWYIQYSTSAGGIRFVHSVDGSFETNSNAIAPGGGFLNDVWYHICWERDINNVLRGYIDGVRLEKQIGFDADIVDTSKNFFVGMHFNVTSPLTGYLDEIRIVIGGYVYGTDGGFSPPVSEFPRNGAPAGGPPAAGTFTLTGQDIALRMAHLADAGTFLFTGSDVAFYQAVQLAAGAGAFVLTGKAISSDWTPAYISTLLWLDASNVANLTLTGSAVDQWNDLSGNGNHVTQSTAGSKPTFNTVTNAINGMSVVSFDGGDVLGKSSITGFPNNTTGYTMVAITRIRSGSTFRAIYDISDGAASNRTALVMQNTNSGGLKNTLYTRISGTGAEGIYSDAAAEDITNANLWSSFGSINKRQSFRNGTAGTANTTARTNIAATNLRVGAGFGDTVFFLGEIAELVVFSGENNTNRQQIEGYLAWKWNTVSSLDGSHPYKSAPP